MLTFLIQFFHVMCQGTSKGDQPGTQSNQINIQASLASDIFSKEKRITHGAAR